LGLHRRNARLKLQPSLSLYWLITGKTIGGLGLYPKENRLDRTEAPKLYTLGSSWSSTENGKKGGLAAEQLPDLAVPSADYFSIPDEEIKQLESVLTIVSRKIVYCHRGIFKTRTIGIAGESKPVPSQRVRWLCKGAAPGCGASHSASGSNVETSARGRVKSHLQVLGDLGLWGLGCDCFAF
jgi:hypothetical protein